MTKKPKTSPRKLEELEELLELSKEKPELLHDKEFQHKLEAACAVRKIGYKFHNATMRKDRLPRTLEITKRHEGTNVLDSVHVLGFPDLRSEINSGNEQVMQFVKNASRQALLRKAAGSIRRGNPLPATVSDWISNRRRRRRVP